MKVYTSFEMANLLGVHVDTVRKMYNRGDLRGSKLGGKNLTFSEDDLRDALDDTANKPARRRRRRAA